MKTNRLSDVRTYSRRLSAAFIIVALIFTYVFSALSVAAAQSASVTIPVKQTFASAGGGTASSTATVKYRLTESNADGSYTISGLNEDKTFSIKGNGKQDLKFTFSHAGVYTFNIEKMSSGTESFTGDAKSYKLSLYVKNVDGGLEIIANAQKNGTEKKSDDVSFDYKIASVIVDPPVEKLVVDKDGKGVETSDVFRFRMTPDETGWPLPEESKSASGTYAEVTIEGSGAAEFGEMEFTKAGTYSYTVREIAGKGDYTYDTNYIVYTYKVTRSDDGTLKAERSVVRKDKDGKEIFSDPEADHAVFVNVKGSSGGSDIPFVPVYPTTRPNAEPTTNPTAAPTAEPTIPMPTKTISYPDAPVPTATPTPTVPTVTKKVTYPASNTSASKTAAAATATTAKASVTSPSTPATGDTNAAFLWGAILGLDALVILAAARSLRKKRRS